MANILPIEKQVSVITALAEGNSIRSVERMTGIHRDTVMRLGARVGENCERIMDKQMRNLYCRTLQMDEIWGFVGMKQKNATKEDRCEGKGDVWTFVCIDAESRMVPAYMVSSVRDRMATAVFCDDVAARMNDRVQVSTDAFNGYKAAMANAFENGVDYGQVIKVYSEESIGTLGRYSPAKLVQIRREPKLGHPEKELISTSYAERQNLTMRMHMRRLTRLTNAFSKKLDNFRAAVGLHFGYYNFVRVHKSLRMTPAMAGGVTDRQWTVEDLITA